MVQPDPADLDVEHLRLHELAPGPPRQLRKLRLLVLVGVPASGKSTVAARLQQEGWAVVCQDVLGDRRACEHATRHHLQQGCDVVIDRCNFNVQQRSTWLRLADEECGGRDAYVALTLRLATDLTLCRRRAVIRTDHPTLNGPMAARVVDRFRVDFVGPKAAEGFTARYVARCQADVDAVLSLLLPAHGDHDSQMPACDPALLDSDADPCYSGGRGQQGAPCRGRRSVAQRRGGHYAGRGRRPLDSRRSMPPQPAQQGFVPQYLWQPQSPAAVVQPPRGSLP